MKHLVLVLLFLVGCGRQTFPPESITPLTPITPTPTIPTAKKVVLMAFVAPWCGPCKQAMPRLQKELNALTPDERAKIEFRLYVETGAVNTQPPTQADADAYKKQLGVDAIAIADPWRMQTFRKYHSTLSIPAGAVTDEQGTLMRKFPAGLDVEAIVDCAVAATL